VNAPSGFTGAVIAGGLSRRMGADKRLLTVGGLTLLNRAVSLLLNVCDEVLVVAPEPPPETVEARHVPDRFPGRGPLAGVHAALLEAGHPAVLCIPVDTPLLTETWLRLMGGITLAVGAPCVPLVEGRVHPLPASYPRSAAGTMGKALEGGEGALRNLLPRLGTVYIGDDAALAAGCEPGDLANVNTPEEWSELERRLRS
jgi:molybdopterin-guanine dinucleotide biosynthesis protein A